MDWKVSFQNMSLKAFLKDVTCTKGKHLRMKQIPIPSMYGIFPYIQRKNQPDVGKYTIHGWHGIDLQICAIYGQIALTAFRTQFYLPHPTVSYGALL